MDLGAYANIAAMESYVARHYGEVPRLRGIRLMAVEKPVDVYEGCQMDVYNDLSLDCDGTAMLEVPDIEFDGESYEVPQITFLFKHCPMCVRGLRGGER